MPYQEVLLFIAVVPLVLSAILYLRAMAKQSRESVGVRAEPKPPLHIVPLSAEHTLDIANLLDEAQRQQNKYGTSRAARAALWARVSELTGYDDASWAMHIEEDHATCYSIHIIKARSDVAYQQ